MIPDTDASGLDTPLYIVVGEIAGLWTAASAGYYLAFPAFGVNLSYNASPVAIALYYLVFAAIALLYFRRLFVGWVRGAHHLGAYLALSAACAGLVWGLLYALSTFPGPTGAPLAPYTDILFASPWYFLPKSAEVLVQQLLIAILVLELHARFHSLKRTIGAYAVLFGGAHVLLYVTNGAPTAYATVMTSGAILSALVFPYLLLRVRAGFVYAYTIHLGFYIALAMMLRTWPPPGYIA